jgi:hypothetical protein
LLLYHDPSLILEVTHSYEFSSARDSNSSIC